MRALPQQQQHTILNRIRADFKSLHLPVSMVLNVATLSGDDEAYFGLVAVNYLKQTIDKHMQLHGRGPLAMLDLGGSTVQVY